MKLSHSEYKIFQKLIFDEIGLHLDNSKLSLVQSRLYTRMLHHKIKSFSIYLKIVSEDSREKIKMINEITTNETYFFRESQHFEFLKSLLCNIKQNQIFRVWSAASSVGAEAYSTAMVLDKELNKNQWQVLGTDINTDVIEKAKRALYDESWVLKIPNEYKTLYCLKGRRKYDNKFLIDPELKTNVDFEVFNLTSNKRVPGKFDLIFLRNVLLYFNDETKQKVLENVLSSLKLNGYLIVSLTENLDFFNTSSLQKLNNSIYKKIK